MNRELSALLEASLQTAVDQLRQGSAGRVSSAVTACRSQNILLPRRPSATERQRPGVDERGAVPSHLRG